MAENQDAIVNAGEQVTTPVSSLNLKPEDQFRLVNQQIALLTDQISRIQKPQSFRLADGLELAGIIIGIIVGGLTAFGLSERINDTNTHQAESERRLEAHMDGLENRLGASIDKLSDQFTKMDERTSTLEGKMSKDSK